MFLAFDRFIITMDCELNLMKIWFLCEGNGAVSDMPDDEKISNRELYEKQMAMLKTFLEKGAITEAQYKHSSEGLTEKMHMGEQ